MLSLKKHIGKISVVIFFFWLALGIHDLPYYGVNWDDPVHFGRGQAILHYFLTKKTNYKDLNNTKSVYQNNSYTYDYFEEKFQEGKIPIIGAGHPPLSDVLASVSNVIFYQKLHILGDIESYHFYGVLVSALGIAIVFYFASQQYGIFTGLISTMALSLYPLFLGESRFNIKDIPEAIFFTLTILSFYTGFTQINWKWIIVSAFCFAFAFGTKFNIVFLPVIIMPWVFILSIKQIKKEGIEQFSNRRKFLFIVFILFPFIVFGIFFLSWPLLWKDPVVRFMYNFRYYKLVGLDNVAIDTRFITAFGMNMYAFLWIIITTPLIILSLSLIGVVRAVNQGAREKYKFFWLLLLWFFFPIFRVSIPHAAIYGGVRQIMEYIPPMAILSGIGASFLVKKFTHHKNFLMFLLLLSFVPITLKLISLHPNESVYFNPLIGGLKGAKERNIPGWGNSLGSTYRQGISWLNTYAEPNAKLATVYELLSNIAFSDLRSDIVFANNNRSGPLKRGEYVIGVTYDNTHESSYHRQYLERFLIPVYQLTVDGVPLLKIWKNDSEHIKPEVKIEKTMNISLITVKDRQLIIDLEKPTPVIRLRITYNAEHCLSPKQGFIDYARFNGFWQRAGDLRSILYINALAVHPQDGLFQYYFAGNPIRYIRITVDDKQSCLVTEPIRAEVAVVLK